MEHALFEALVDYIEIDCAYDHAAWNNIPLGWREWPLLSHFTEVRRPDIGLQRIQMWRDGKLHDAEGNDTAERSTHALKMDKVWALYHWWKAKKAAKSPWRMTEGELEAELRLYTRYNPEFDLNSPYATAMAGMKLEEAYNRELTEKLHELIDVRGVLWT